MNKKRTVRCDSAPGAAGTSGAAWNGPLFLLRAARQLWSPQAGPGGRGAEAGQGGRKQRAVGNQEPGLCICRRGKGDTQGTSSWGLGCPARQEMGRKCRQGTRRHHRGASSPFLVVRREHLNESTRMLLPRPRPEGQARTPPGSPQAPRRAASGAQRLPCAWLAPEWRVGSS